MSSNVPMTLRELREALQTELDKGNKEKSLEYLQILERCKVTVHYIQESKEEKNERVMDEVRNKLISAGVNKFDTNQLLKSNPIGDHETADDYFQRVKSNPAIQQKSRNYQ